MKNLFDLNGKVAIVTGGNGGIGLGIARGLAYSGARLVIAARDGEKSAAAVEELRALGREVVALELEVANEDYIVRMMREARAAFGRIDILVNNAGSNHTAMADEFTADVWREVIDTNLVGPYLLCREAYPHLKANGGGKIINIGSVTTRFGSKRSLPYSASKSGLTQLTQSLALAWAADNIQVNTIMPGWVETDMTAGLRDPDDASIRRIRDSITARIPSGRWGRPEDMAGAAVFLASGASDYVTGAVLTVDGGYSVG